MPKNISPTSQDNTSKSEEQQSSKKEKGDMEKAIEEAMQVIKNINKDHKLVAAENLAAEELNKGNSR